jgi:solute carrier family 5 (sodium-coupled monocarboxylate transporter), member 8/12
MLFVMFSGLIIIIIKGTLDIGSFSEMLNINRIGGRLDLFNFDPNPFVRQSFWSLYFGITVYYLMPYCIDQQMVQRFSSAKNVKTAQIALLLNAPGIFLLLNLCFVSGLVVFATYAFCDPLTKPNAIIKSSNQILPYFVIDRLTSIKGAAGLFLSSIFAGALSSLSSILNSSAAILWQDFFKNLKYFQNSSDNQSTLVTKFCVIIVGILSTIIAFLISTIGGNILTINFSLNGAFNAPIVGVFILASVFSFTNKHGATIGLIAGFTVGIWLR